MSVDELSEAYFNSGVVNYNPAQVIMKYLTSLGSTRSASSAAWAASVNSSYFSVGTVNTMQRIL
jgi:hypothetical protein